MAPDRPGRGGTVDPSGRDAARPSLDGVGRTTDPEGEQMTTTYTSSATADAAVEQAVRAIVDRLGAVLAQEAGSRDLGADAAVPTTAAEPETPRWMVPLLGQLAQVVAQAAPTILQGIMQNNRDIFGEGSRDAETTERFFGSLFSAIMPVVAQAVPALGQLFAGNRSVPTDDEELQTRWLLPLLGAVLPQIVQAVPPIVSALTSGRRSVALTDPNEATRFFGPILSGLIPALTSSLPSIVSLFTNK
jgi:hypothetical protein